MPAIRLALLASGLLLTLALTGGEARAQTPEGVDQVRMRSDMQRMIEQRRRELLPEYQRRVRREGRASADTWLQAEAARLGRRDGERVRRDYERARDAEDATQLRATANRPVPAARQVSPTGQSGSPANTRSCAKVVTRRRVVPSVSGGAMPMIMVTECVRVRADRSEDGHKVELRRRLRGVRASTA